MENDEEILKLLRSQNKYLVVIILLLVFIIAGITLGPLGVLLFAIIAIFVYIFLL